MDKLQKRKSVSVLKQGFMVRKGRVRHTWKTRWFVLHEDRLTYYHKTDRSTPVGCVLLEGASVVSPVPEYDKREAVFKLCKKEGKEYLLQAPSDAERDLWVHAISAVIRSMAVIAAKNPAPSAAEETKDEDAAKIKRGRESLRLPRKVDLSEVLSAMQDNDAGVRLTSFEIDDVEYKNCFPGSSVIDWLIKWMFVETRDHATKVAEELLILGHLQPIVAPAKKKSGIRPDLSANKFYDSQVLFYRYSSLRRSASEEFLDDSGSDLSGSSEGEESEDDFLEGPTTRLGKGRIIKEGFLMKKGHDLRKKWKVRRVVLRDEPLSLEYYSTSKTAKKPLKLVALDGARVLDLELVTDPQEFLLSPSTKKKRHLVCVQRPEGHPILLEAQDEYERVEWIKCLQKLLHPPHSA